MKWIKTLENQIFPIDIIQAIWVENHFGKDLVFLKDRKENDWVIAEFMDDSIGAEQYMSDIFQYLMDKEEK